MALSDDQARVLMAEVKSLRSDVIKLTAELGEVKRQLEADRIADATEDHDIYERMEYAERFGPQL